jgi:membrane associated rhomboid family serine protease
MPSLKTALRWLLPPLPRGVPAVVLGLVALCVLPEAALLGADLGLWGSSLWRSAAYAWGGFWPGLLQDWRPNFTGQSAVMFASYGFLHSGPLHLVVNMATLLSLGPPLVDRIGQGRFAVLYILSVLGGAAGFALLSDTTSPMVGASGALFGLAGAWIAWDYTDRFSAQERLWPVARAVGWLVVLNLVLWWAMNGQLAWQTHLGGFVTGWVAAGLLDPRPRLPDEI